MKVYRCKLDYDNGVKREKLEMIVCAENSHRVPDILRSKLYKHHDESIENCIIEEIQLSNGDAFILNS